MCENSRASLKKFNIDLCKPDSYDLSFFENSLKELGVILSDIQRKQFVTYYELLMEWNRVMNLTAITEFEEVMVKHFIDSLSLLKGIDLQRKLKIMDIGTGAGFPGIPLKIVFPDLEITLLDSLKKRIHFLGEVIVTLGLQEITAVHGRAEDYGKMSEFREQYDICVSRAVSNMTTLSEICIPFVKQGGFFIPYKSGKIGEELEASKKAVQILGGTIENQVEFCLPGSDMLRKLVFVKKVKATPKKYPRKAGTPSKEPLF